MGAAAIAAAMAHVQSAPSPARVAAAAAEEKARLEADAVEARDAAAAAGATGGRMGAAAAAAAAAAVQSTPAALAAARVAAVHRAALDAIASANANASGTNGTNGASPSTAAGRTGAGSGSSSGSGAALVPHQPNLAAQTKVAQHARSSSTSSTEAAAASKAAATSGSFARDDAPPSALDIIALSAEEPTIASAAMSALSASSLSSSLSGSGAVTPRTARPSSLLQVPSPSKSQSQSLVQSTGQPHGKAQPGLAQVRLVQRSDQRQIQSDLHDEKRRASPAPSDNNDSGTGDAAGNETFASSQFRIALCSRKATAAAAATKTVPVPERTLARKKSASSLHAANSAVASSLALAAVGALSMFQFMLRSQ